MTVGSHLPGPIKPIHNGRGEEVMEKLKIKRLSVLHSGFVDTEVFCFVS